LLVIGCSILENELRFLAEKNGWNIDFIFLDSSHHCELDKLMNSLVNEIEKHKNRDRLILYGACHPMMDRMLAKASISRMEEQNCIEMLLGRKKFQEELLKGAFFLLEDWAKRWDHILSKTFPKCRPEIVREIFQIDRKFLLAIQTPCSGDFSRMAREAADKVDLPLRWMETSLDHLEHILKKAIETKGTGIDGIQSTQ
jgi:hypothetical protein